MKLMQHQIKGVEFFTKNTAGAFFWEVGTGKTIGALSTYEYLRSLPEHSNLKLLVICPLSLIEGAWIKEIEKSFPHLKWADLHSGDTNLYVTRNAMRGHILAACHIWIINFEYLISERKFTELYNDINKFPFMCAIDESSKMKNHQAKTTERILHLKNLFKYRLIMSGTPAPNIEWEYWAQMYFLDPVILGDSFHAFKNRFFSLKRGNQIAPGRFMNKAALREMFKQGFKYELLPAKRPALLERLRPYCQFVAARDCIDLPEEVDEFRVIDMTDEQRDAYDTMKELCVLELKETQSFAVANVALTKLMKLRQITSGFVIDEDGLAVKPFKSNPKMEALMDLIEECGKGQIIIWGQFHAEIEEIVARLVDLGGVSVLYGKIPQADRINQINRFLSGENQFLVAHPDSAAHGLTFVNCHLQIFYSLSYSFEEYSQARGRTMRYGQKNNCVYFHLIAKKSIDEDVLAIVQKKATAADIAEKYLKA